MAEVLGRVLHSSLLQGLHICREGIAFGSPSSRQEPVIDLLQAIFIQKSLDRVHVALLGSDDIGEYAERGTLVKGLIKVPGGFFLLMKQRPFVLRPPVSGILPLWPRCA